MEENEAEDYPLWRAVAEWLAAIAAAAVIAFLVQRFLYTQVEVHNVSMRNTLLSGDRLIEDRWSYHFVQPKRGDIVIINRPEGRRLIKRVISVPGDVLDIRGGRVWIDGEPLNEPYANGATEPGGVLAFPYTVGPGELIVMGDNRENSLDSRGFGPVPVDSVEGKAVLRIYPINTFGKLKR